MMDSVIYQIFYNGIEGEFLYRWRGCQIPASLPQSMLDNVGKDIHSSKTCSNIPMDRQLPDGD